MSSILIFTLITVGVLLSPSLGETTEELVYVDMLRDRYLSLEKAMWLVIRSGVDRNFVLDRVHQTHKTFFNEYFNDRGVELLDDDSDQKQLLQSFQHIRRMLDTIQTYYTNGQLEEKWLVDYAERGKYMTVSMDRIYNVTEERDFFRYIRNKGELQNCNIPLKEIKSTNQMLYDYYTDVSLYQLKAYVITQLSYMLLTEFAKENNVMQGIDLRDKFIKRSRYTQARIYDLMNDVNKNVYMCDPDEFLLGDNYDQVTRLLQGYIDNEVNLNPINDCKRTCEDHKVAKNYQCFNGTYCANKSDTVRCKGEVVDCHYVGSQMTICPSPKESDRRYEAIEYDRGYYYGEDISECGTQPERAESWIRWFVHCSNCFCYCDEPGPKSDRYFSLRPVLSNTEQNMIITGVSLIKINRIFTWKVTEAQLISNGEINKSTLHLKTGHLFKLDDTGIEDGVDYHTLNWKNRSINLDTLYAPEGKVVTGIRFNNFEGRLTLEIKASLFDFNTGRIIDLGDLDWIRNSKKNLVQVEIHNPNVPTRLVSKSVPDFMPDTYIDFGASSKELDVAQTTIPFIDTQFVEPTYPVPLAGIGIYYKGQPNSGGFIAPKLVTYDFRPHFAS